MYYDARSNKVINCMCGKLYNRIARTLGGTRTKTIRKILTYAC
jgi:hypothetical protein